MFLVFSLLLCVCVCSVCLYIITHCHDAYYLYNLKLTVMSYCIVEHTCWNHYQLNISTKLSKQIVKLITEGWITTLSVNETMFYFDAFGNWILKVSQWLFFFPTRKFWGNIDKIKGNIEDPNKENWSEESTLS